MRKVNVVKRGKVFQYKFEIAPQGGKRKFKSKSGFKTRASAFEAGCLAYNEYIQTGRCFEPSEISYSDYLDYWMKEHVEINLKYNTVESYRRIINIHLKPKLGCYQLAKITSATLQEFINKLYRDGSYSKNYLKTILKVVKCSFTYATDVAEFLKTNPSVKVKIPRYDEIEKDPVHIFTKEEVNKILKRFSTNHCIYYAFLTAYYTGLRVSEVFGLTWDDIDLVNKTINVDKIIVKRNQEGGSKKKHVRGKSKTVWYFGTCKTKSSVRVIDIGNTLVNALKEYKLEQEIFREQYGDSYIINYKKEVKNPWTGKQETKIVSACAEIEVALPEAHLVFVKNDGTFEGNDTPKYPFKVIHYELGIPCRFHDFRDTHATRLIESGADIKAVSKRLGHSNIQTTYNIYVRVTEKMEDSVVNIFEEYAMA